MAVVVPAADEQDTLAACLDALVAASAQLRTAWPTSVRIVLVLDSCTDRSAAIAARFDGVETLSVAHRRVGRVRAAGAAHALAGVIDTSRLWLASTDADSIVPLGWLSAMAEFAANGADLVLGAVTPGPGLAAATRARWWAKHDLVDGHGHVHAANLGIRADLYDRIGGWPPLASGEDHALVARAAAVPGVRVVRTARQPVQTSPRLHGRAPRGFSSYLRGLACEPDGIAG